MGGAQRGSSSSGKPGWALLPRLDFTGQTLASDMVANSSYSYIGVCFVIYGLVNADHFINIFQLKFKYFRIIAFDSAKKSVLRSTFLRITVTPIFSAQNFFQCWVKPSYWILFKDIVITSASGLLLLKPNVYLQTDMFQCLASFVLFVAYIKL